MIIYVQYFLAWFSDNSSSREAPSVVNILPIYDEQYGEPFKYVFEV